MNSGRFTPSYGDPVRDAVFSARPVHIPVPVGSTERSQRFRMANAALLMQRREADYLSREFIAWDGEGITTDDGIHRYVLLANSREDYIVNENGIPSWDAFNFLLETPAPKGSIHVAFGAGYDINMMLSDWEEERVAYLYSRGFLSWGAYRFAWRPGKSLSVRRGNRSVTLYDCLPFFQCSFDSACASYLGEDYPDRALIQENKALRGSFTLDDLPTVIKYNSAELRNLVTLMQELRLRLNKVGLRPARWDGPGAVAAALFKREFPNIEHPDDRTRKVRHGFRRTAAGGQVNDSAAKAARFAYAGGRFEIIRTGSVAEPAYEYDVNSAYPAALRHVPCLTHGRWRHYHGDNREGRYALYRLSVDTQRVPQWEPGPLFCRMPDGAVCYPPNVTGWYWTPEREAAEDYIALYGGTFRVLETFMWEPAPCAMPYPFSFIDPMFEKRRKLKAAGDGAHVGIKLGLNSLYGKTAQQVGWRPAQEKNGKLLPERIPPYHQIEWAGYVTSWCRATVLRAAMQDLSSVIAFETDALFTTRPLNLDVGSGLGQWEETRFDSLAYVQSGMYFGRTDGGKVVEKTRGVDRGTLHLSDLHAAMAERRASDRRMRAPLTRFNGAGIALAQDFNKWRKWETIVKEVSASPVTGKRLHEDCPSCQPVNGRKDWTGERIGVWHETYCPVIGPQESCEYPVEWVAESVTEVMSELEELRRSAYERYDNE